MFEDMSNAELRLCGCGGCRAELARRGGIPTSAPKTVDSPNNNYGIPNARWESVRKSCEIAAMPNCCSVKILTKLGGSDNSVDGVSGLYLTPEEFKAVLKHRSIKAYDEESQIFAFITTEQEAAARILRAAGFRLLEEYDNPKHGYETEIQLWAINPDKLIDYVYGEEEPVTRRFGK